MTAIDPGGMAFVGGVLLAVVLVGFGAFIVGLAGYRDRKRRWEAALGPTVRSRLFERLAESDPDWDSWAARLSEAERAVAADVLDEHLRQLDGDRKAQLVEAAEALDIDGAALRTVRTGDAYEKLSALTWLTLLEAPVDVATLREECTGTPNLRAGAARLLYAGDRDDKRTVATDFLLAEGTTLSVFGWDTLYRLNRRDPGTLAERATAEQHAWSRSLTVQVLSVIEHAFPGEESAPIGWITRLLGHESAEIRAAALRALSQYGWRRDVRERIDIDGLARDGSPLVRCALYETLAEWGDPESVVGLLQAIRHETDDRVLLVGVQAAYRHVTRDELPAMDRIERTWDWVEANAAVHGDSA